MKIVSLDMLSELLFACLMITSKELHSALHDPSLRGQCCVSMGKSWRFMGQMALMVILEWGGIDKFFLSDTRLQVVFWIDVFRVN